MQRYLFAIVNTVCKNACFKCYRCCHFRVSRQNIRPSLGGHSQKALFYGVFTLAPNGFLVSITLLHSQAPFIWCLGHFLFISIQPTLPIKKSTHAERIYLSPLSTHLAALICSLFQSHIVPTYPTLPIAVLHTQPQPKKSAEQHTQ